MLVRKFPSAAMKAKNSMEQVIVSQFMVMLFGVIHISTLLENLLSVIVMQSNDLFNVLMSPETQDRVRHLR